jgi:hypothetical protein
VGRSRAQQSDRTLVMATRFLEDIRREILHAAQQGADIEPRVRSVHERQGHATPEFRTLAIPIPEGVGAMAPDALSGTIARYARRYAPDCLLLALEAETEAADGSSRTLLIAEARDRKGTRMYWMQPFRSSRGAVDWDEPLEGGWRDPGEAEMVLDEAFAGEAPAPVPPPHTVRRRAGRPPADREVVLPGTGAGEAD